jgi:hypothetical protein
MTEQEIKEVVEDYFKEMLVKDTDYLDHVTDSWIYDAEDWFLNLLSEKGIKRFILKKKECDYQEEEVIIDLVNVFREIALERFDKLYDEKYGKRDALFELDRMVCDVALLNKTFKRVKHHFKKFNVYTDTVSEQFEELAKNLRLLYDIENGRVESLK